MAWPKGVPRPPRQPKAEASPLENTMTEPSTETIAPSRAPMRPAMREDDPRARADARAAELRDHLGSMDQGTDKFAIDQSTIPDGWSYEWKTLTVYGAENPSYQVGLRKTGWEPVPASRHPELMPTGYRGATIVIDGQQLMERPKEITEEVKKIDANRARRQVRAKEEQLVAAPQGQFERANKDQSLVKLRKTYEPMPIPE